MRRWFSGLLLVGMLLGGCQAQIDIEQLHREIDSKQAEYDRVKDDTRHLAAWVQENEQLKQENKRLLKQRAQLLHQVGGSK